MRILWVGTKPPWPPVDGGRVLSLETIRGLSRENDVTLVVPAEAGSFDATRATEALRDLCRLRLVAVRRRSRARSVLRAAASGLPFSIAHHARREVESAVARLLGEESFDIVHAEQLQAFQQCRPALARGIPVVLREQNVESDLWGGLAAHTSPPLSSWLRREGKRLAAWEGEAVRKSAVTVALTSRDAERLAILSGAPRHVETIPVPFPGSLPHADRSQPGAPSLVLFGSATWKPNQDGSAWFLREIWPAVRNRFPGAVVHAYGLPSAPRSAPGIETHASPENSVEAFAPGSILIVPLRFASGARMRILEGFARGLPVVATSVAANGLDVDDNVHLLTADTADEFIRAFARLTTEPDLVRRIQENGRSLLEARHDPGRSLSALLDVYARTARTPSRKEPA